MKKIMILGTGAQGTTVAERMDEEPNVAEIICADYNKDAVDTLVKSLTKARGIKVDASNTDEIAAAAEGVDLIVNALPLEFGPNVLDAALKVKCDYQDFAATDVFDDDWIKCLNILYDDYGKKFKDIGKTAIIGTGSAPGLICVVARNAMKYLDSCETINMMVYEGVQAKRFLPFWWSPVTALSDMSEPAYAFENGEIILTEAHSRPYYRNFKGIDKVAEVVEHSHDEPVYVGFNSEKYFKGVKNAYFKYGGVGVEFAKPLYQAGLLSKEPVEVNGQMVVPFDVILKHLPEAPRFPAQIKEILDEGLVSDTGAMVVEAIGKKDGKDIMVETYVLAPGCVEAFERSGITGEMYQTGQGGALFTKLFVNDKITQKGLYSSDMLEEEQVEQYLKWAEELDITLDIEIKEL